MPKRNSQTEQTIRAAVAKLLLKEGRVFASAQEIADSIGITRTSLNYYFRTKEDLFEDIFRRSHKDFMLRLAEIVRTQVPFRQKIEAFIDEYSAGTEEYPFRELFMLMEYNKVDMTYFPRGTQEFRDFIAEIQENINSGEIINHETPAEFMANLFALLSHPILTKNLISNLFNIEYDESGEGFERRKRNVMKMLFKNP